METFGGEVLFLDRSDINTDEIIPAKYLTESKKEALKPYLLEDLKLEGFDPAGENLRNARVVVSRENFGCGSSREHAPWAFQVNGITTIIAASYARIFRQNMFNCGMLAVELSSEAIDRIFGLAGSGAVICDVDLDAGKLAFKKNGSIVLEEMFAVSEFDGSLVKAGGWVEFADAKY